MQAKYFTSGYGEADAETWCEEAPACGEEWGSCYAGPGTLPTQSKLLVSKIAIMSL